ncbi:hypothetical protein [Phaeodactylibacter luteus]|uniref:Uncharacterized protein n=1 Tax=Phaeodactylibacter luteus TaxID=1564516 RepID=A0A5C6RS26_9BACT|nr:hypothetical protein [Phaeodactylibacter luteus]TXB64430.1 hypothetical protein FRY97_06950 [Phaeodactylibacter luteus]
MSRYLSFFAFLSLLSPQFGAAQDHTLRSLPPQAIALYPTLEDMHGYALGQHNDYILVFGGSIRSRLSEKGYEDFPNLDILLIDLKRRRASAFTNGNYDGSLGEQMSATGLSYQQQGGKLYLLGGYGYSESHGQYLTFPYITVVDLPATIDALLQGEAPIATFQQICDERMAIFDAEMDFNGQEFFLVNGKIAYKVRPFSDQAEYVEESYQDEVRTFQLEEGPGGELRVSAFQTWYDLEAFRDQYGTLIPERIEQALRKPNPQGPAQ